MRPRLRAWWLILAATGWFATGPAAGLVTLASCHHERMDHMAGHHQHAPSLPQGPCFCAYMSGGPAAIVPAVPAPTTESLLRVPPESTVTPLVVRVVPGPHPLVPPDPPPPRSA